MIKLPGTLKLTLKFTLLLLMIPLGTHAGPSVVVLSDNYDKPVAVMYKMRADYIAQTVTITSNERDFSAKLKGIKEGKKHLIEYIERKKQVILYEEPAYLYPGSEGLFKGSYGGSEPQAQVQLLLPIVNNNDNIFSGGIELAELLRALDPLAKTRFQSFAVRLAVEDPEKLRGKVLEMISADVKAAKERMKGAGKITISGLEGPVKVNQVDDINVELFIEYRVSLEIL
ncbi:MAG: hypothetical protein RRA15_03765 [bacterium]|nr:hypothetical protein [bacterium]MDT8365592.1 hypothetical protein [bacterium]